MRPGPRGGALGACLVACALAPGASASRRGWRLPLPLLPYPGNRTAEWTAVAREAGDLFNGVHRINASIEVTGHIWMYPRQSQYYHQAIAQLPPGAQMCEVGFGSGLSTLGYLRANPTLRLLTFDLWDDTQGRFGYDPVMHQRKVYAEGQLLRHFRDRWTLVKGNSYSGIPRYFLDHPEVRCDVVHIDGNHTRGGVLTDLVFFQPLVPARHFVLMDDLQYRDIQGALRDFHSAGGLQDGVCFHTDRRDVAFTGRHASRRSRKNWCHFAFKRTWAPDYPFEVLFLRVTGREIPPAVLHMARAAAAAAAAGGDGFAAAARQLRPGAGGTAAPGAAPALPPPQPAEGGGMPLSAVGASLLLCLCTAVATVRRAARPRELRPAPRARE
eukprot:TRINITY_DN34713_c0_g1_i1.p1 TRINITY_DN34713_c0_g1~~TRINITY_DN34713_c0_g1_i1.p1  ORF type:complete len:411 (+),score=125.21 TRINITY_DN34713_c0_g1_i1:83-1234(+)